MSARFRRDRHRRVAATFDAVEAALLRDLTAQLVELVEDGVPTQTEDPFAATLGIGTGVAPEDPVLVRLLPDAYAPPPAAAAPPVSPDAQQVRAENGTEFRRYTETGLRQLKGGRARAVRADLDAGEGESVDVRLDGPRALEWLTVLTDLRLALATRIGLATEADAAELDAAEARALRGRDPVEDPRLGVHRVYTWLGWLQETLVRAMP